MKTAWRGVVAVVFAACGVSVQAQQKHAQVAVPFYRPSEAAQGLYRGLLAPRAQTFAREAAALSAPVQALCDADRASASTALAAARAAWQRAVDAWERLAAVPLGPLIERRSMRQLDFTPARPELIERAIQGQPAGPADMERVGTPAKGLPALEWLLWARFASSASPATPACLYAVQVAKDLTLHAAALEQAVEAAAEQTWDEARGDVAFTEFINQWVGATERLRWAQIDKPRREAATRGQRSPAYPRQASGQTAASWARQWQVLRELAVFQGREAPRPGQGVVPLETYLRGRGLNALAGRWARQVDRAGAAMQGLRPGDARRLDAAVRELAALKALAEAEVAPALEISIGFSDADGD